MIFKTLKDKCEYYRGLTDYRLLPNGYVLVMIDGKNFSKLIKNKFEKPFDDWFINTMNETAEHLCRNIQGCMGAYVQSDEISLIIKDHPETCLPYDGRLCKLQSIIPALATAFFMKKIVLYFLSKHEGDLTLDSITKILDNMQDYLFDCKAWVVPSANDAVSWFLYRNIDCVRNSKQQFYQTYMSHNKLMGKTTDEQVKLTVEETGHDWNKLTAHKKYGRILYKILITKYNDKNEEVIRHIWQIGSCDLTISEVREWLYKAWELN